MRSEKAILGVCSGFWALLNSRRYVDSSSLECKGCQPDHHGGRQEEGLDDDTLIEEGDQDSCKREKPLIDVINKTYISLLTNSVGLDDGKCGQKDQVNGSFLPLDVECDQKSNGEKKRREQKQGFALEVKF